MSLNSSQIRTLIFMDFETTGLIIENGCQGSRPIPGDSKRKIADLFDKYLAMNDTADIVPQITEMSFLSVPRQNFDKTAISLHNFAKSDTQGSIEYDMSSNFYSSQCKPELHPSKWEQYERCRMGTAAIHLSREDLMYKNTFKEEWPLVHMFLQKQKKPACIIAHNGVNFDFRVLYWELKRNELLETYPIPEDIYFLDSLLAFQDIEKLHFNSLSAFMANMDWEKFTNIFQIAKSNHNSAEKSDDTLTENDNIEKEIEIQTVVIQDSFDLLESHSHDDPPQFLKEKSVDTILKTPTKRPNNNVITDPSLDSSSKKRKLFSDDDEKILPLTVLKTEKWSPAKCRRVSKSLFNKTDKVNWTFNDNEARDHFVRKGNFSLEGLYRSIVKSTYKAHHAYDDCKALLQVSLCYGKDFTDYMDTKKEKLKQLSRI